MRTRASVYVSRTPCPHTLPDLTLVRHDLVQGAAGLLMVDRVRVRVRVSDLVQGAAGLLMVDQHATWMDG